MLTTTQILLMNRRKALQLTTLGTSAMLCNPFSFLWASNPKPFPKGSTFSLPEFTSSDFGDDFKWGVATAAYQIEGAWNVDGKGPSIWDTFSHTKGKIKTGETGDTACDFYNKYASDIALIKAMNFKVFRFSLSWSRIMPTGEGEINPKGVDFYHKVIDECIAQDIEPWITLYHWDLPQALQDQGGWANRKILDWFNNYVEFCTKAYGDKVKNWMVLNEPAAFGALGYLSGMHAPGIRSPKKFFKATHHICMCQAEGGRIIRKNVPDANIGSTFSCSHVDPINDSPKHKKAVSHIDALLNRLYLEPVLGLGYPVDGFKWFKNIYKYVQEGDEEKLQFDFDFIGLQNYSRSVAKRMRLLPIAQAWQVPPQKRGIPPEEITAMGWEVYPEGIYKMLKYFDKYEGIDKIIVTENGSAFPDVVKDGRVHDEKRQQFFQRYLANVLKAKQEGVNVQGYFLWTLMDNFEWAEGYKTRFGVVHVDFETQERIIKDSGLWFQELLGE